MLHILSLLTACLGCSGAAREPTSSSSTDRRAATSESEPRFELEELQRIVPRDASAAVGHELAFDGDRLLVADWWGRDDRARLTLYERRDGEMIEVAREGGVDARRDDVHWLSHVAILDDGFVACDTGAGVDDRGGVRWLERRGAELVTVATYREQAAEGLCAGLATDGTRALVTARRGRAEQGEILWLVRNGGALRVADRIAPTVPAGPWRFLGDAIALSERWMVAGGELSHGDGAVYLRSPDGEEALLRPEPGEGLFGGELALDRHTLAIRLSDGGTSRVAIYEHGDDGWRRTQELSAPSRPPDGVFGHDLAVGEDLLAATDGAAGAAYVYRRHRGRFELVERVSASGRSIGSMDVEIHGDVVAIGLPGRIEASLPGAVALYRVRRAER